MSFLFVCCLPKSVRSVRSAWHFFSRQVPKCLALFFTFHGTFFQGRGGDQAGDLVGGAQSDLQLRLGLGVGQPGVALDSAADRLGDAGLAQHLGADGAVAAGVARDLLQIAVMDQAGQRPLVTIVAQALGQRPHHRLGGQHVSAEVVAGDVLVNKLDGARSIHGRRWYGLRAIQGRGRGAAQVEAAVVSSSGPEPCF